MKALQIVSDSYKNEESVSWRDACEKASDVLLSKYCGSTIEFWCLTFKENSHKIPMSKMGTHSVTKDLNPFLKVID